MTQSPVTLYLQVLPLALTAFCLAWIVRQILADTHGMFAATFRAVTAALALSYALSAYLQWRDRPAMPPVEVVRNYLILAMAVTAICFHGVKLQRL